MLIILALLSTMKLPVFTSVVAVAACVASTAFTASAFQPFSNAGRRQRASSTLEQLTFGSLKVLFGTKTEESSSNCAIPNDVIPDSVTAQSLRSAVLTNANGEKVRLDEKMGPGTSVVIFLRHLG